MHLFADDSSSNAASIGNLIEQVAAKVNAELVVLAQHNQVCSLPNKCALTQSPQICCSVVTKPACAGTHLWNVWTRICSTILYVLDNASCPDTLRAIRYVTISYM